MASEPERWRVPVRIDLAGGTLDLWPIYALMPGCITVNAAVDLWITLEIRREGTGHRLSSLDLGLDFGFQVLGRCQAFSYVINKTLVVYPSLTQMQ